MLIGIFSCMLLICNVSTKKRETLVETTVGPVLGVRGPEFYMFLGVPYGIVEDPFAPASFHPIFNTTYKAINNPKICPQIVNNTPIGSIHCLHLNIYVPNPTKPFRTYPVMVYIHGGAFVEGDGNLNTWSPKFLVRHDVIVVTINYRVGPYGFLCIKGSKYNNVGLKDQVLALKWIKDNVKLFGGDDSRITLFGHSAGAVAVDIHLLYNNDQLFNKAIVQSGHAVFPIAFGESDDDLLNKIANKLNFSGDTKNVREVVSFLSAADVNKVLDVSRNETFRPCIDGTFITKIPKTKSFENITIITGNTNKDVLYFFGKDKKFYEEFDYRKLLSKSFNDVNDRMTVLVKDFYTTGTAKTKIINFGMDFIFHGSIERSVEFYLENKATVYRYEFSYKGGRNLMSVRDKMDVDGATHGDELGYLFDIDIFDSLVKEDSVMVDQITNMWTNFAKYGNPSPTTPDLLPLKWLPVRINAEPYLIINTTVELSNERRPSMSFWSLYYEMFRKQIRGIHFMKRELNDFNGAFDYNISFFLFMSISVGCVCLNVFLLNVLLLTRALRDRS